MAKEIILYNLAPHVTDEEFRDYVENEKGSYIDSLPSVEKYELVRIDDSRSGVIPFKYVGIVHLKSLEDFKNKDTQTEEYRAFTAKMASLTSEIHVTFGEEIH
ncbi:MAG TPA: hypothetical protein VJP78_03405 [Thermoleophilia bacterium]|nr:hypothetical protein [Thermoleophilia bacterium]